MNNTYRDWKGLPAELLHIILQLAAKEQLKVEACNIALVCKAWKSTAQAVAYADITIKTSSQFIRFHNVIKHSPELGVKVKSLHLLFEAYEFSIPAEMNETDEMEVSKLLTSLLTTSLPNLEALHKVDLHICVPSLHTLLNSSLKKLRRLQKPSNDIVDNDFESYVKCALTMKERLESIYITWGFGLLGEQQNKRLKIEFQRLYNNLYQFNNLVDIKVVIVASDGVQILEHIIESCRSLKDISMHLEIPTDQPYRTLPILEYNPRSNIKSLSFTMSEGKNDHNLPWYIMHKFTRLEHLSLDLNDADPVSNILLIPQLFDYVSTINKFFVSDLSTNQSNLMEAIGSIWEKTAKPGSESLLIVHPEDFPDNVKTMLDIARKSGEGIRTTLEYPTHTDFDWRSFMDFLKRNGKYIGTISFDFTLEAHHLDKKIPENFFHDTLTNCPNLKNIHFNGCSFRNSLHAAAGFDNRFSINELAFQFCSIQPNMLNQLSPLLYNINRLRIFGSSTYNPGNRPGDDPSLLIINMPYTHINCIAFEVEGSKEETYVKVVVSTDGKCYYYKVVDTGRDHWIQTIQVEEYSAVNRDQHVYTICLAKPTLETCKLTWSV